MTDNTLIISLTTWPPRIESTPLTLSSLGESIEGLDAKIILVLSTDEFPYGMSSLPDVYNKLCKQYNIEILFDEGNIKAHKKLMPTIEKYPHNDILVFDDDKIYSKNTIEAFIESHRNYPNDVIVGRSHFRIVPKNGKLISILHTSCLSIPWEKPNILLYNSKQASGLAGTLYPKYTFTNSLFYDRKLMMDICEESDEDWQFLFNILEDRTLRANSIITKDIDNNGYTDCALFKRFGQKHYNTYYDGILKIFPEFYDKLDILNKEYEAHGYPNI